jgi:C-terminal processing protease CtpA/Prc
VSVHVVGANSSPVFGPLLDELSATSGVQVQKGNDMMGGSDHMSFGGRKIPVLFFFTGMNPQYHGPDDDAALINVEGERRILELVRACVENLAGSQGPLPFSAESLARRGGARGRPRLGVEVKTFQKEEGALVVKTEPESPGGAAGIREGDVIVAIGSAAVRRAEDLTAAVGEAPRGESIAVKVRRGGGEEVLHVTFPASRGGVGVRFGSMPDFSFAERGVRFQDIRPDTPAAKAGVKAGDILVSWNGKDVENLEQWTSLLSSQKSGDEVTIRVRRGNADVELKVRLETRD